MAQARMDFVISHWYQSIGGVQASPQDFYASVEKAIQQHQIPDTNCVRVSFPEAGPFSPRRQYLRVMRKDHVFDICGAPFGPEFFVSWWLSELPRGCLALLLLIPVVNWVVVWTNRPTYYKVDTAMMFQTAVHSAVLEVVDQMTTAKGVRALSELERKPVMRGLFGK